jgi:hypothetical protein
MICTAAALVACTESPTAATPPIPNIAGSWSGTVSVTPTLRGTLQLSLAQAQSDPVFPDARTTNLLTGTWSTAFSDTAGNASGIVAGIVSSDSAVSATLQPGATQGTCSLQVSATLTSASSMSGTIDTYSYSAPNSCTIAATWQFTAVRQ